MTAEAWFPTEGDLRLRIWMSGVVFDYSVTVAAVHDLIHDWRRKRWMKAAPMRERAVAMREMVMGCSSVRGLWR